MTFKELVEKRYSFRGFYPDRPVEPEKIRYITECARLAPSSANRQPWRVYVVESQEMRQKLHLACKPAWFAEAPVILVMTGLKGVNWQRKDGLDYLMCDVTIITDYLVLAATEVGLGTVYIGAFDEALVRQALQLPEDEMPFLMTPLGYARDNVTRERSRKPAEEVFFYR